MNRSQSLQRDLVENELSCVICQDFVVPFVTTCPNRLKEPPTNTALYESNANNHYCCLKCFTLLLSGENRGNQTEICPICQAPHGARIRYDFKRESIANVTSVQSLLPPKSLINIIFGNQKKKCIGCSLFAGTFVELVRHYFEECKGFVFFCPHCRVAQVSRRTYHDHYPNNCRHVVCSREECQVRLFPISNTSEEAKRWRLAHEKRHTLCDSLKILSNQISYCTPLLQEIKHASFVTQTRDLFDKLSIEIVTHRVRLQTRHDPEDMLEASDFCLKNINLLRFICDVLQIF